MVRTAVASAALSLLVAVRGGPSASRAVADRGLTGQPVVSYISPVAGAVVRRFEPPRTRFGAGHRGVDFAAAPGASVRAAADGVVVFAGVLAGRGVVVLRHADGIRTEYEPIRPTVRVGTRIRRGVVIGYVHGGHGSCAPDRCLHWGARRAGVYIDPLSLLRALGRVHLVPWLPDQARG